MEWLFVFVMGWIGAKIFSGGPATRENTARTITKTTVHKVNCVHCYGVIAASSSGCSYCGRIY